MSKRIVFPTNEHHGLLSKRDAHFGRANFYTVVDIAATLRGAGIPSATQQPGLLGQPEAVMAWRRRKL